MAGNKPAAPLHQGQKISRANVKDPVKGWLTEQAQYINGLDYLKYNLHWVEYQAWYGKEAPHEYFSSISDIRMDKQTCCK